MKKYFIITLDTEGDNIWNRDEKVEVENAKYLPRFQNLCEKYNFKPTYLTNYEMAKSSFFVDLGKSIISNNSGEIGMHLHAWNSPPLKRLTHNDWKNHPYLIEYPYETIEKKIIYLTDLLENTFQLKMISHRAGRWAFNNDYAKILIDNGYKVDCSVTPGISWEKNLGDPKKNGGSNYKDFPNYTYFLDKNDISKAGDSEMLEVPMTIITNKDLYRLQNYFIKYFKKILTNKHGEKIKVFNKDLVSAIDRYFPPDNWLRPNMNNLNSMMRIVDFSLKNNHNYIEFMLHTSELMPGGSSRFKTEESIDKLYNDLDKLFQKISKHFTGVTLAEFYRIIKFN